MLAVMWVVLVHSLVVCSVVAEAAGAQVQMIVLHGDEHASCLDGSPYAFYIKPGSTDSFTIGIHGGEYLTVRIAAFTT
jgi:hypothetical protein